MRRLTGLGIVIAVGLAGCAKPPVVAMAPPPPAPVGHAYHVLAQVPPTIRRMTPTQKAEIQQAFNVIALKSSLMVAALSCNQQSQYDAFMTSFQPHVLEEQHVMDAYFKRLGGRSGQSREDEFVTLLANNQSVGGIAQGKVFCLNNQAEFHEVLALRTPTDLDSYVTDQAPPPSPDMLEADPTPSVVTHHRRRSRALKVAENGAK